MGSEMCIRDRCVADENMKTRKGKPVPFGRYAALTVPFGRYAVLTVVFIRYES